MITAPDIPTILVVEDDEALLAGLVDILEMTGYRVLKAINGNEALKTLRKTRFLPSVIVSDIGMPGMNGLELLKHVRQESAWTEIPFIFLTAYAEQANIRHGMTAGADDYLPKPFQMGDLLNAIHAKLERSVQLATVRAMQIKEIKRNILTTLNHEFRTPLSPVVAYSDMLSSDPKSFSEAELQVFLQGINKGAQRLHRLVEELMLLIELETGEAQAAYEFRRTLVDDLPGLFNAILDQYADLAAAHRVQLTMLPIPNDLPPFVADVEYLQAGLNRLVENAIKFSNKTGSWVTLSAAADGDTVLLRVADQGRGIPEAEFKAIFDSFYQINRQHYEDQGTGSGLAIAKAVAELHHGTISLISEVGVGSTFVMALPAA